MGTTTVETPETGQDTTTRDVDPRQVETVSDVAADLGTTAATLRKWAGRHRLLPPPTPGRPTVLTAEQASNLRHCWRTRDTQDGTRRDSPETPETRRDKTAETRPDPADGWRELVSQLRADLDTAKSQLSTERVARDVALRRVEEAERGRYGAEARLESLRAAWWQWRTLLDVLGPLARLRRRWPEPPAELLAERLLGKPEA